MRPTVTFYTRRGCSLCEEGLAILRHVAAGRDLAIEEVDVDADPELRARYTDLVPVAMLQGEELFRLHVDPTALEAALDRLLA